MWKDFTLYPCLCYKELYSYTILSHSILKENPKGVSEVCKIVEDMINESLREGIQEEKKLTALRMLEAGKYVLEEISNISGLSLDEVKKIKAEQSA